jgi:hypothetical protein
MGFGELNGTARALATTGAAETVETASVIDERFTIGVRV